VNSQQHEYEKFVAASGAARDISLNIPEAVRRADSRHHVFRQPRHAEILTIRRRFVIRGSMSLGDFSAFNGYLSILIFPVIMIGFMSNVMAQRAPRTCGSRWSSTRRRRRTRARSPPT